MKIIILILIYLLLPFHILYAQYHPLWIPDTMSGPVFNLTVKDTFAQLWPTGNQTITGAVNNSAFSGPTLIFNK